MTREHTVLMLLAVGPASRSAIVLDTGWGIEETRVVVDALVSAGKVVAFPGDGNNQRGAVILCLPEVREATLRERSREITRKAVQRHRSKAQALSQFGGLGVR